MARVTADDIPTSVGSVATAVAVGLLADATTGNLPVPRDTIQSVAAIMLRAAWPAIREHFASLIEDQHPEAADTIRNH